MSSDEDDIADRVSNRVPITVNGQKAEAVCSTGSNVPNCWMSKAYFTKIGLEIHAKVLTIFWRTREHLV